MVGENIDIIVMGQLGGVTLKLVGVNVNRVKI